MAAADLPDTDTLAGKIRATQSSAQIPLPDPGIDDTAHIVQFDPTAEAQTRSPTPPTAGAAEEPEVDESALRYFAARGDTARLKAEIARLRALYPNWQPPADPLAVPQHRDAKLEAMWRLYSEGKYAEVRRAIAERQASETTWQAPADLLERLSVAEARVRLVNASELKQYDTVVSVGAENPSLLNCADVDVLWRVAEAFVKTDRASRGQDAYRFILKNCTNPAERLATIQKAAALLPYESVQPLLAFEKTGTDGSREFDSVRDALSRSFVAEANRRPEISIDATYLERVKRLAANDTNGTDSLLLGWYYLRHNAMPEAEKWFRTSRDKSNTASASQGLALTLIARKAPAEAEEVMFRWKDDSEDASATYLAATANLLAGDPPPEVPGPVLQRIAAAVVEKRYVPTAQQMGWYARAFNQPQAAIRWFQTALQWKADDEPSAYGLAITQQQLNNHAAVEDIRRQWAGRSQRIANLGLLTSPPPATTRQTTPPTATAVEAPPAPAAATAPTVSAPVRVAAQRAPGPKVTEKATERATASKGNRTDCALGTASAANSQQALSLGWCLMNLNRPLEASEAFEKAAQSNVQSVREDAAYGQSLAYLRLGLTNKAAIAATQTPQTGKRAAELQTAILADRAVSAFNAKRYREALVYLDQRARLSPDTTDLAVLRGYAYMNLGMYNDAWKIFEFVAETGNSDASRGLAEIRDMQNGYR
ncbi:tetratricopeptide repeat protein [Rhizobium oryzicola]